MKEARTTLKPSMHARDVSRVSTRGYSGNYLVMT